MITALIHESSILGLLSLLVLIWSAAGAFAWCGLADTPKPVRSQIALAVVCGPVAVVLLAVQGLAAARRAILRQFGVSGHSCCGGGYDHGIHAADRMRNHP